jgi:hypothetical protein
MPATLGTTKSLEPRQMNVQRVHRYQVRMLRQRTRAHQPPTAGYRTVECLILRQKASRAKWILVQVRSWADIRSSALPNRLLIHGWSAFCWCADCGVGHYVTEDNQCFCTSLFFSFSIPSISILVPSLLSRRAVVLQHVRNRLPAALNMPLPV